VTFLTERLAELKRHLEHLRELRPRVSGPEALRADLSLHNDVLFSLLSVAQLVIDISGELSAREGLTFGDYTEAVRNLGSLKGFPSETVERLARLPGFRDVLIHEHVGLDYGFAVTALDDLDPVDAFVKRVAEIIEETESSDG